MYAHLVRIVILGIVYRVHTFTEKERILTKCPYTVPTSPPRRRRAPSTTARAAHAVAPNLAPPPEERRPVRGIKPLERSKHHRRRLGTPPRRDAGCGSQWRFPRFRACARPRILGGDNLWRIDGLLTQKLYRNGCIEAITKRPL
jgi:hypothetical protein